MAATITKVYPSIGKEGDNITIEGTGFVDTPNKTKVYKRESGDSTWDTVTDSNVTFVSATELTVALAAGDSWDGGLNDIGVSVDTESIPEDSLLKALSVYVAGTDDPDKIVIGAIEGLWINGEYMGDFGDAQELNWDEELVKVMTQHSKAPVKTYKGEATYEMTIPLAELSLENIKKVFGSSASIADLETGRRRLTFGGETQMVYCDVMMTIPWITGKNATMGFYRACISASGTLTFEKDGPVKLPLKITILEDTSRAVGDRVGWVEEWDES